MRNAAYVRAKHCITRVLMEYYVPWHEVIVPAVHFVISLGPGGVRHAGAEPGGELTHEVVVQAILQRTENDHGTSELEVDLLHGLVRQHGGGVLPIDTSTPEETSYIIMKP